MEANCLRYTEIPGTSRLFADYQYNFDRVARFYGVSPHSMEGISGPDEGQYPAERRRRLADALERLNPGHPALEVLARRGTMAIVTGQQVGLFTGAAYTIYKALTAARLAAEMTAKGRPAVAIFWAATEDHDVAEVDHCAVFDKDQRAVRLAAKTRGEAGQPAGTVVVEAPPLDELEHAIGGLPFGREAVAFAREAYRDGGTLGKGFLALTGKLLRKFGLLQLDPLDPSIREIASPFLREALGAGDELSGLLGKRGAELAEAGYHSQVHLEADSTLFFRLEAGRRFALRRGKGGFVAAGGRTFSESNLASAPELLSPNALLRPVMQDFLLPTGAYVGGPAEIAYFAQSEVIYRRMLGRMPAMVARASFTLIPERYKKLMTRYGLTLPSMLAPAAVVRQAAAARLVPAGIREQFAEARRQQAEMLEKLSGAAWSFDATLERAISKSRLKMEYQLSRMEQKVAREALRREERAGSDVDGMLGLLAPERHLQERYFSYLPFYASYGDELTDSLYEHVHPGCPDHKIITI